MIISFWQENRKKFFSKHGGYIQTNHNNTRFFHLREKILEKRQLASGNI